MHVGGRPAKLLHLDNPKPWERSGWLRLGATDYIRLMRRLLFASDVPLSLDRSQAPLWLRPRLGGELTLRASGVEPGDSVVDVQGSGAATRAGP